MAFAGNDYYYYLYYSVLRAAGVLAVAAESHEYDDPVGGSRDIRKRVETP